MVKVHRRYRYTWWQQNYPFAGMTYAEWCEWENKCRPVNQERYTLHFLRYDGDGIPLQAPFAQQAPPSEQNTRQQAQRRLEQSRARREQEHIGIPGGIEDALEWYYSYLKLAEMRTPEKQAPLPKEEKQDFYRDMIIDLYRTSGYSIGDSVEIAYSKQGDELRRYLSDDKRHTLNHQE